MSIWFVIALLFFLLVVVEESIYYSWNRYIYGVNLVRRRKWQYRMTKVLTFYRRKRPIVIHETDQEKSSL